MLSQCALFTKEAHSNYCLSDGGLHVSVPQGATSLRSTGVGCGAAEVDLLLESLVPLLLRSSSSSVTGPLLAESLL